MNYSEFAAQRPILYGQINVNDKCKIGSFKAEWHHLTNSLIYSFYSPAGNKGKGGFTLKRAFALFIAGNLSINPENGNPLNYI
jgi:hypothetical protein